MTSAHRQTLLLESRQPLCLAAVGLTVCLAAWWSHRCVVASRSSLADSASLLERARLDARQIRELRTAPRIATERIRPNDELIRQVQSALAAAEIPMEKWTGNEPAPAVRLPQTPYKQLSVRLTFEELTMRQLLQLAFQLTSEDQTLSIAQVRMTGPSDRSLEAWNVDLTLSYLLYAPQAAAPPSPGHP